MNKADFNLSNSQHAVSSLKPSASSLQPSFCRLAAMAVFLAFMLFGAARAGALLLTSRQEAMIDRFVRHVVNCEFDTAFRITDSLVRADKTDPMGPLLRLFAYGMEHIDFDQMLDSADFFATYESAVKKIAAFEEKHGRSSHTMTLAGMANATHSAFFLRQKRYFKAIGTGLDALRMLHDAKKADSTNYDVDFFLGLYDYAKAELRRRLWMVLFWYGGDKEDGIRRLKDCIAHGSIAPLAAKMSLADIYINEKRYELARTAIDELLADFPESRFIMWTDAKYYVALKKYSKAAGVYARLSESYSSEKHGTFNSLNTYHRYILMLCKAGRRDEARAAAKKILDGRCRKKAWRTSDMCREIQKMHEKGKCDDND
jgi:tetratricopeptide (TPR) repeat protein